MLSQCRIVNQHLQYWRKLVGIEVHENSGEKELAFAELVASSKAGRSVCLTTDTILVCNANQFNTYLTDSHLYNTMWHFAKSVKAHKPHARLYFCGVILPRFATKDQVSQVIIYNTMLMMKVAEIQKKVWKVYYIQHSLLLSLVRSYTLHALKKVDSWSFTHDQIYQIWLA